MPPIIRTHLEDRDQKPTRPPPHQRPTHPETEAAMSPVVRLCRCGRIPPPGLRHCPGHQPRGNDTYAYQQASRHIRATATHCWLCHEPFTPDDPATADHIIPRSQGGTDA